MSTQVIPFSSWSSLVRLRLDNLANIAMPLEEQGSSPSESLRSLRICGCNAFFSSNPPKRMLGFWDYFAFVEDLLISDCDDLVSWPEEELRRFDQLQYLQISRCCNFTGSSSEEAHPMPQLKRLSIHRCDGLLEIPKLPASIEELDIFGCSSLVSLPSNLGSLAKLRVLQLERCYGLRMWPDGMGGFTALQELQIWSCPGIETPPDGLLQRLPTLKSLSISGCAELQRRCRRGGEYWDFVSPIPDLQIPVEPSTPKHAKTSCRCLGPACCL